MNMIIPERGHRWRYLTLKNAAFTGIALAVALILLSLWSQLPPAHSAAAGNLFESRMRSFESPSAVHHEPVSIVLEGTVDGHLGNDSILIDAEATRAADASVATTSTDAANQKRPAMSRGTVHVDTAPAPAITRTAQTAVPAQSGGPPQSY